MLSLTNGRLLEPACLVKLSDSTFWSASTPQTRWFQLVKAMRAVQKALLWKPKLEEQQSHVYELVLGKSAS